MRYFRGKLSIDLLLSFYIFYILEENLLLIVVCQRFKIFVNFKLV